MWKSIFGLLKSKTVKSWFSRAVASAHKIEFPWSMRASAAFLVGIPAAHTLFLERDKTLSEKLKKIGGDILMWGLTLGIRSPVRQAVVALGLEQMLKLPRSARSFVQLNRSILESRTMAAVPFSYSNQPIDHAFATFQYTNERLGEASQVLGAEAAIFAARYGRN